MNVAARFVARAGASGRACAWRALRTAGAGDGGDEQTPIGDPPDDDGGTEPDEDDEDEDQDEDDEDDEPLHALPYCAAASPWATHRGTMAFATQRRMPKP